MSSNHTTKHPRPKSNRFSPRHIWTAHLKGLRNRNFAAEDKSGMPDVLARSVLYLVPLALAGAAYWREATVVAVDGLLAAAGVLAGGLFMAFSQIASWRERYSRRQADRETSERPQRYSLDETVAHVMLATYACFALLATVLVGANFANKDDALVGVFAALTIGEGTYLLLLMLIIIPKLYTVYAVTHVVDDEMSGLHH